jgi:hypothetical protein
MKRAQRVHSPSTTKRPRGRGRQRPNLKQIEDRFAVLLLLLQHNIRKLLRGNPKLSNRR